MENINIGNIIREGQELCRGMFSKSNRHSAEEIKASEIRPFPKYIFDALRPYHLAGLPLSILLFTPELCNGKCYDRALAMSLAFKDCKLHCGSIETLRLKCNGNEDEADHAFIEADGGIFDTSIGLVYTKDAYWEIEKPKIRRTRTKQECMESPMLQSILGEDFDRAKHALPLILPNIENIIMNTESPVTKNNQKLLMTEITKLKAAVQYDNMKAEQAADIELMRTDPAALDKKYGIVRDEYGAEISRNGTPNPYYKKFSPEHCINIQEPNCRKKLYKIFANFKLNTELITVKKEHAEEDARTRENAAKFLQKVQQAPTANVYDL